MSVSVDEIFGEAFRKSQLPEPALAPAREKLDIALRLITTHNSNVLAVRGSRKAADPNNPAYLDTLIQMHCATDPEMTEEEKQYQHHVAESERLLKSLREKAKKHIQPPLSSEEIAEKKKAIQEGIPVIATAKAHAEGVCSMIDSMLESVGEKPEGGIVSLLPSVESATNIRAARKDGTTRSYMTRASDILINGKPTAQEVDGALKSNFNFAADALSKAFGQDKNPANAVTAIELEEKYLSECGYTGDLIEMRAESKEKKDLPEKKEFVFEKVVKNEDSTKETPRKVTITVIRDFSKETEKSEPEKQEAAKK